jgi:hypothetical protein
MIILLDREDYVSGDIVTGTVFIDLFKAEM